MTSLRTLTPALALAASLAAPPAAADTALAAPAPEALAASLPGPAQLPPPPSASSMYGGRGRHVLGLQLDAGAPDGAGATLLYRPLSFVRLGGGLLYNSAGYGLRGGVTLLPYFPIAPTLTLEAGHYFEANAANSVGRFVTIPDAVRPLLERVGYTFVSAQVGLEVGHPDWFVFFVRGGLSRVWLSMHDARTAAQASTSGGLRVSQMNDPQVTMPDVKVGFAVFFY